MNKFCIKPTLVLAASLLFLSCGEQKPEAKTSLQQMVELNDAYSALMLHIAYCEGLQVFNPIDRASELGTRHKLLLGEGGFADLTKDLIAKIKEDPDSLMLTSDSIESVSNISQLVNASIKLSARNIRSAKPTDESLKEAYDKLGDAHSKFEAIYNFVIDPSGNVLQFNRRMSDFVGEVNVFSSWWKREIASQVE